jgi:hypothetical protein
MKSMKSARIFLANSAAVALMATSAFAQSGTLTPYTALPGNDISASELMDMRAYATRDVIDVTRPVSMSVRSAYDDIGPVEDILLSPDGQVKAIIVEVAGFLGIDSKEIAIDTSSINFAQNLDDPSDWILLVNADKAQIKAMRGYVKASSPIKDAAMLAVIAASDRPMLRQPTIALNGYITIKIGEISTGELEDAATYGSNDKDIGKVEGLVLAADGKTVDQIVFDIGGFLGMGVHRVALTPGEVQIMRRGIGKDIRVYLDATKAELEAQPEYKS